MAEAVHDLSIRQWFLHRRMLPKWAGLLITGTLTVWWLVPQVWWLIPLGFVLFFPIEYTVHRWVYHFFADKPLGRFVSKQHVAHHEDPQNPDVLFNEPRFGAISAIVLFLTYLGISGELGVASAIAFGNYMGFVYYEWVHLAAHRPHVTPWMPWNRALKRYHLWHHFKHERYWYGVTTSVFDRVFRSWRDQAEVEMSPTVRTLVPPEAHVPWLTSKPGREPSDEGEEPVAHGPTG